MKKLNFDSQQRRQPNLIKNIYICHDIYDKYFNIRKIILKDVNKHCWIKVVSLLGKINWSR